MLLYTERSEVQLLAGPCFRKDYILKIGDNNMGKKTINLIPFIAGIILALTGAILMFLDILPLPARITIGIIGIGLIATSKFRLLK
jgi:hypothetical protein